MVHWVQHNAGAFGAWWYVIFGLLAFAEDAIFVGFVIPGETSMVLGGFLAYLHVLNFWGMLAVGICAAVAGDQVGYEVGRQFGPALTRSRLGRRVGERNWQRAEEYFGRRGGPAVFLGRWVAVLRATVPAVAGITRMRYRSFLPWNAFGGITWAAVFVTLGYVFGRSLHALEHYLSIATWIILGVVVLGAGTWIVVRRRRAHQAENDGA